MHKPLSRLTHERVSVNNFVAPIDDVGIFSNNLQHVRYLFDHAHVGGVIHGDVPSRRVDHMPYGWVKDSGQGREGVKYAMEDMTELKLLVLNPKK
jgi:acyl-CoA reductase-like NAD-dependent aldehyde dehydrogenase